ncbi:MAG: hypothetical protein WAL59_04730 [Roseiarcus sp.]
MIAQNDNTSQQRSIKKPPLGRSALFRRATAPSKESPSQFANNPNNTTVKNHGENWQAPKPRPAATAPDAANAES